MTKSNGNRAIAFVFARGGSKGLPRKNVKLLGGKPLIAYSIQVALSCRSIERVIVSTEDEEIAEMATRFGAEVPFQRPAKLAEDDAPEWLAWQHAIAWSRSHLGEFDTFVSLPATSPFRTVEDVEKCVEMLNGDARADIVVTGCPAARSPYFNMVTVDENKLASLAANGGGYARRQDAPPLFDLTTVAYAARPDFVMNHHRIFDGRVQLVEIPVERCLDIDTEFDFEIAECLAVRGRLPETQADNDAQAHS